MNDGWNDCGFDLREVMGDSIHSALEHSSLYPQIEDKTGEISVVLTDDIYIQTLNREYRGKNKPTNVLSFPQFDPDGPYPPDGTLPLGDIILAYETITREAQEQEKSLEHHFRHLIVHGTLHLLGYDHETDEEAEEMEALEIEILKQMGVENPYSDTNFMA